MTDDRSVAPLRERLIAAIAPEFREPGPGADPPLTARQRAEAVVERIFERDPTLDAAAPDELRAALDEIIRTLGPAAHRHLPENTCEGCEYEINAAIDAARAALRPAGAPEIAQSGEEGDSI